MIGKLFKGFIGLVIIVMFLANMLLLGLMFEEWRQGNLAATAKVEADMKAKEQAKKELVMQQAN